MGEESATIGWARRCYGVDLSGEGEGEAAGMVIVRAERVRGSMRYEGVSADAPEFRRDVEEGCPVVGCISVRESFTRWVSTPLASVEKVRRVLPTLLDIHLPFALEDCLCDFLELGRAGGMTRALAVAARRTEVQKRLESFGRHGLDPMALDPEGLALWTESVREWAGPSAARDSLRVVIHLGRDRSTVVIGRGREYRNAHGIQSADAMAIGRLVRAEMAIGRLVRAEMATGSGEGAEASRGAEGGVTWVTWAFSGPGAVDAGRVAGLHAALSVQWPGDFFVHREPERFLARAMATRALTNGPLRCNLRSGDLTHPAMARRSRRRMLTSAGVSLAAGLLLCAANLGARVMIERRESRIDRAFVATRDMLMGHGELRAKGRDAIGAVRNKLAIEKGELLPFLRATGPSLMDWVAGMSQIGKKNGLTFGVLTASREKMTLDGTADRSEGCDELVSYLKELGFSVKLDRREAQADGRVPFHIRAEVRDG